MVGIEASEYRARTKGKKYEEFIGELDIEAVVEKRIRFVDVGKEVEVEKKLERRVSERAMLYIQVAGPCY